MSRERIVFKKERKESLDFVGRCFLLRFLNISLAVRIFSVENRREAMYMMTTVNTATYTMPTGYCCVVAHYYCFGCNDWVAEGYSVEDCFDCKGIVLMSRYISAIAGMKING